MFDTVHYNLPMNCETFEGSSLTNLLWRVQIFVSLLNDTQTVEDISFGHFNENEYIINVFWKPSVSA